MWLKGTFVALILGVIPGLHGDTAMKGEKYRFKLKAAAGDHSLHGSRFEIRVKTSDMPSFPPDIYMRMGRVRSYTQRIVAVDSTGAPTKVVRSYSRDREQTWLGALQMKDVKSPVEGRTITLSRAEGLTIITRGGDGLSLSDRAEFLNALSTPIAPYIPGQDVSAGEEWEIDYNALFGSGLIMTGKVRIKLLGIESYRSRPSAHFTAHADLSSKDGQGEENSRARLALHAYFATDIGKPLTIIGEGPLTVKRWRPGVTAEGTIRAADEISWLALGN